MRHGVYHADHSPQPLEDWRVRAALKGYYWIAVRATLVGLLVVALLDVFTPLDFFLLRWEFFREASPAGKALHLLAALVWLGIVCSLPYLGMRHLLCPVRQLLAQWGEGEDPPEDLLACARRRVLNLPFIFSALNLVMWLVVPSVVGGILRLLVGLDLHTMVLLAMRAFMVGMIASAIAFFLVEAHSRRSLIPMFFPKGHLADEPGTIRIPISRRIRLLFLSGTVLPGVILLATLVAMQFEVEGSGISAVDYGRDILVFTVVLCLYAFASALFLNYLVCCSICDPVKDMLEAVQRVGQGDYQVRVPVVSNDELGQLGDAGNAMIRGLAERQLLREQFGKYVTPEIRDHILSGRIPLNGERRQATVLFSDLRGFTSFVEEHPPEEVMAYLRAYFTAMHRAIRAHRGLVLQFVGDEIEAVFGVPVPFADHTEAAVQAALDMRRALAEFNAQHAGGRMPPLAHGIGLHTGPVLAGNSGSEQQSAYALIGSTVNVASRLQDLTKDEGWDILVSEQVVRRLKGSYRLEQVGTRRLKNYSQPVVVYRLIDRA